MMIAAVPPTELPLDAKIHERIREKVRERIALADARDLSVPDETFELPRFVAQHVPLDCR